MAQIHQEITSSSTVVDSICPDASEELIQLEREPQHHCQDLHNDLTKQLNERVQVYEPRDWVNEKLQQIKSASSLSVQTYAVPQSVNINANIVSVDIVTNIGKTATVEISFFKDGIVKLNCINPSNPSKFSFELIEKPADLTPLNLDNNVIITPKQIEVNMPETQTKFVAEFESFAVKILSTKDNTEQVLLEMNATKSLVFDDNLTADFTFHTEHLYGLPEHATDLLLQDTKADLPYRFFNQDIPSFPVGSKNALYATVPIIMSRSRNSPTMVSMYWQNCSDTYIDIHRESSSTNAFWLSERGNLECYLFANHSNSEHFKALSNVFGHCAMPQYFSLGYHQCRWSYKDEQDVLHVNEKFNEHEIPCDSITLDIDHTDECRYFTWNNNLFPDPVSMQDTLAKDGRQLVTIADPHIKVDPEYHVYKEGAEKSLFVKNSNGEAFVGKCWPGDSVWLDFMNEETRECWASQYSYEKYQGSTPNIWAWNDMNEPSVFENKGNQMPLDNIQTVKSLAEPEKEFQVEHREVHNIYGYGQHKATYAGLVKRNQCQNIRPHVLTRSFYAGSQKWTTVWTGDTAATWDYLQNTVPQLLNLSLCGISFCGGDVGGFIGDPEPELALRWYQLGTYMPYFRAHSETTTKRREPWLYDKKGLDIIKESIRERYRLLPYWYSTFEDHCKTAIPVLRPIWFDQTTVPDTENMSEQERFMVGDAIMVAPIVKANQSSIKNCTRGLEGRWYDYHSKQEMFGGEEINTGLEKIGCFVKGGNIVPTFDIRSYVKSSKDAKESNINLIVACNKKLAAKGKMYFDDGETFDYKTGSFMKKTIEFEDMTLTWRTEGASSGYNPSNRVTKVVLMGLSDKVTGAYLTEEGKGRQKVRVHDEGKGFIVLEFVALATKNWSIVLV